MSENPNGNNIRNERTNLRRKISQGDYNYVENLHRNKPFSPPHSQQNIISQENYKNKNGNNSQPYMNPEIENIPEENPQINKIENMQIPSQNIQLSYKKMNSGKKQELSNPNVNQNGDIFTGMYFANKINMPNQQPNSGNSNIKQLKNIDNNDENEFVKSQQNLQKNENKLISNNMQNPISNKYGYINKNQKNIGMNNNLINNNNINFNNVNNIQSNNNIQNKMLNNNQLNDFNNNIIKQNNFLNNNNGNNISNNNNNSPGDNKNMNMNMNIPCTTDTIKNQLNDFSIFNKNNIGNTIKSNDNQNEQTNQVSGQSFTNQGNENSQQLISNNQNNNMENPYSKNNFDNKMNDNANTIKNENSNQNNNMENPYSKITLNIKMDDNANIMKNQNINMNGQNQNQNNNINFMNSEGNSSPNNILMNNNNLNNNNLMNNQYINTMKNKNNNNTIKNQSNSNKNLMNNQHNSDFNIMNIQNNNNFMDNQNNQDQNNFMINQNNNQDQNNFMNNQNNQNQNNFINIQNKQNQNNFMNNQNNNQNINNNFMNKQNNEINNNNFMNNQNNEINNNNFMNNQNNQINNNNFMNNQNNQDNNNNFMINQNQNNFMVNQNNKNLVPKESQKYSFSRYKKASKVGLELLGDTSYLNAVLQFLGSIRNIASYFLNPKNADIINKDIKHKQLSFVIHRLFTHLYPFPETDIIKNYKPGTLLKLLGQINNVYNTAKRRNPNELISFILNRLNNELIIKGPDTNQMLYPNNITDKAHVINIGCLNFQKFNNSIISNNLNWFEIKEIKCTQCGNNMYYFQTYNTFELDILFAYNYIKKPIRIYDCLKVYGIPVNPNQFCIFCRKPSKVLRTRNIYSSSNIFIFSLDRKNLDPKYLQIPFIIDEKIEITNFVEMKDTPQHYQLTGIVSYYTSGNKYVSFCMSPVDKQWYLYNDENVQLTDISQVIDLHNNKKEFIPCLLAYKTVKV